jgi:predicted GNAT family acetyltransferase
MNVIRCATGADFLQRAEAFLVAREVENCVPLGIANQLRLYPDRVTRPPYLATVEHDGQVLAAAAMTPPMRLVLAFSESREALNALAEDVASVDRSIPGVSGPAPSSLLFAEQWQQVTGATFPWVMAERVYQLTEVAHPVGIPGGARRASANDRELLIEWLTAFDLEAFGSMGPDVAGRLDGYFEMSTRGIFLWEDGRPVSLAAFGGFTPHGARIGPVYTPPAQRGHGYASAMTAWLSQHLLDGGRQFCCLYTDLSNPTSNHIYQAIGYVPVGDVTEYRFSAATG